MSDAIEVTEAVSIPRAELVTRATRAGGPGGQHVNTSSTRIELLWNVRESRALDEGARERVLAKLASRIDADGWLRIVSSEYRSQLRNREAAEERLAATMRRALAVPRPRKRTKPPRAAVERRLEEKKRRGEVKRMRRGEF